jgi:hypothetical protein
MKRGIEGRCDRFYSQQQMQITGMNKGDVSTGDGVDG